MNLERINNIVLRFLIEHKKIVGIVSVAIIITIMIVAIRIGQLIGNFVYKLQGF